MKNAVNSYLDFVHERLSPKTHATYKTALQTFSDIVGDDVELSKDVYIKFLRSAADMNPSTQAICRSAIKGLFIFSGVDASFFQQTDKTFALKTSKRPPIFNREGIEKIIQYANTMRSKPENYRDRTFIYLLADSGLRISEACNLRIGDIDWSEQKVSFIGKGDKPALLHLSNRTIQATREYLDLRKNASKAAPLFIRHDKRVSDLIKPVKPDGMWHAVKRRAIEAGVDPKTVRVHDFRHYFVTVVYHAKGIRLAQKLARHERIETTSRYTHLVEDEGEAYNEIFNQH